MIYLFAWSNVFTVKEIVISGAPTKSSKDLVFATSEIELGEKLARIEPNSVEHRIQTLTWVREVKVSRDWISGRVDLVVAPRIPKAYYNGKTLDVTGKTFELPGFDGGELPEVSADTPDLGVEAVKLFRSLPSNFRDQVLSLTALSEGSFSVAVAHKGRSISVKWGKNEENELKTQVFEKLLGLPENKRVKRVDLSAPHAPIVK